MPQTYKVIVADPPWIFSDKLTMSDVARGAAANYELMSMKDIKELPIKKLADPEGCVLALWVPSSLLQDGLDTMKAWGFEHKQTYIWVKVKKDAFKSVRNIFLDICKIQDAFKKEVSFKDFHKNIKITIKSVTGFESLRNILSFGMGRLFRQTHEIALIGTSNKGIYKSLENKSQRSVSFAPNLKHSSKPDNLQKSLEEMFPLGEKLELFARRRLDGWTCLGNEICNGEDIRDSLAKL